MLAAVTAAAAAVLTEPGAPAVTLLQSIQTARSAALPAQVGYSSHVQGSQKRLHHHLNHHSEQGEGPCQVGGALVPH